MPDVPGGTSRPAPVPTSTHYSERLAIGPFGWALLVVFALMIGIAFYPVDVRLAAVIGLGVLALGVFAMVATAPVVQVDATTFRAGEAHIPRTLVGAVLALDRDTDACRARHPPRMPAPSCASGAGSTPRSVST